MRGGECESVAGESCGTVGSSKVMRREEMGGGWFSMDVEGDLATAVTSLCLSIFCSQGGEPGKSTESRWEGRGVGDGRISTVTRLTLLHAVGRVRISYDRRIHTPAIARQGS